MASSSAWQREERNGDGSGGDSQPVGTDTPWVPATFNYVRRDAVHGGVSVEELKAGGYEPATTRCGPCIFELHLNCYVASAWVLHERQRWS